MLWFLISGSPKLHFIYVGLVYIFQILFQLTDIENSKNHGIINLLAKGVGKSENNKHIPQEQITQSLLSISSRH